LARSITSVRELLFALFGVWVVVVCSLVVGAVLLRRAAGRRNRVMPDRPSPAPLSWLWSWRGPARLHRRLRRAVQIAEVAVAPLRQRDPDVCPLVGVADDLAARAGQADTRLVAAAGAPGAAGFARRELTFEVGEIEASAVRLSRLAATWQHQLHQASDAAHGLPPLELNARLDAVESALSELAAATRHSITAPAARQLS
jgi:hypothetical protein